jgi:hypothetical protein
MRDGDLYSFLAEFSFGAVELFSPGFFSSLSAEGCMALLGGWD